MRRDHGLKQKGMDVYFPLLVISQNCNLNN